MNKIVVISLLLFLTGCVSDQTQPVVTVNKTSVLVPPKAYLSCPLTSLPNSFTTNKDVAKLIVQQWHDNQTCHNNMIAVENYLNKAQATVK